MNTVLNKSLRGPKLERACVAVKSRHVYKLSTRGTRTHLSISIMISKCLPSRTCAGNLESREVVPSQIRCATW